MGVTGLWRLIEPAGKPVPVESLENKVLAVDISIWLHQIVKGYQDAKGAPLPNAHLMGLFQRLCKLLYFRIKPVFVFDGAFPELKKETIAKRQDSKTKYNSESERLKREIALLLSKKTAIGSLLGKQISPKKNKNPHMQADQDDIFKLPALPEREEETESESEDETNSRASTVDLHSVDIESDDFKSMSVKEKYDLLIELKETRKMNSWGKLDTLPKKSDNFSDFQMQRLLKRRKVQECLEETEKEMGDTGMSLNELESLLNEEGIDTKIDNFPSRRIASDNTTRYLLINNVQHALADAKKREMGESSGAELKEVEDDKDELDDDLQKAIKMSMECEGESSDTHIQPKINKRDELEEDLQKAIKMSLEIAKESNSSDSISQTDDSWSTCKTDSECAEIGSDSEEGDGYEQPDYSTAKCYIMQYSDFTHKTIDNIVAPKVKDIKGKTKCPKADKIIEELNQEKSVIVDNIDLSSGEDEIIQQIDGKKSLFTCEVKTDSNDNGRSDKELYDNNNQAKLEMCINNNTDMDTTQSSVVYVDKPYQDVINLDTSSEEIIENKFKNAKLNRKVVTNKESDSSEDEFEEVLETDIKPVKPVVQVTLTMSDTIEDDIFADIFDKNEVFNDSKTMKTKNTHATNSNKLKLVDDTIELNTSEGNKSQQKHAKFEEKNCSEKKDSDVKSFETNNQTDATEISSPGVTPITKPMECDQNVKKAISSEVLNAMVGEIENNEDNLLQEKGRMDRIGRNITEQMTKEAQELLRVFGIPYIVAPMEAEAQCAFLESINLTDGTITDDSDIWLFGGKTVYKNFFNQKKHVLQYLSERIEKTFNLSREQLILLALLVGSDYTTGVTGVGPVTALEILASFPFNKRQLLKENSEHGQYQQIITGLQDFKKWVRAGRRTDNINLKKKLRNVTLGDDFPSVRVVQAYLNPNVEKSEDKFTWGELNITELRDYAKAKFGWSQNKLDVIVQPVLKRLLERKTQKTVQDYFKRKIDFQSLEDQMSKRVKAAVQKMDPEKRNLQTNSTGKDDLPVETEGTTGSKQKGRRKRKSDGDAASNTTGVRKAKTKMIVKSDKVCTSTEGGIEINVPKTDRLQEIIPQREKDMQNILQNKLKAIEIFRKTNIDRKRKPVKKRVILPKDKADLSESSDSD